MTIVKPSSVEHILQWIAMATWQHGNMATWQHGVQWSAMECNGVQWIAMATWQHEVQRSAMERNGNMECNDNMAAVNCSGYTGPELALV